MKKTFIAGVAVSLLAAAVSIAPAVPSNAAAVSLSSISQRNLELKHVDFIDNTQIPVTQTFLLGDGQHTYQKFTIDTPAVVKVYYSWENATGVNTISGSAWFSNDEAGKNVIGSVTNLSKTGTSMVAYLDAGTYYINQSMKIKQGSTASYDYINVGALIQECPTNITFDVSSFDTPNGIALNKGYNGFLSTDAKYDYYIFTVPNAGKIDICFDFQSVASNAVSQGKCSLYDVNQRLISSKNFSSTAYDGNTLTYYADPGTYYVVLSGVTAPTYLNVNYTDYTIRTSQSVKTLTNEDVKVYIETPMTATEALVVPGEVGESKLKDSSVWSAQKGAVSFLDDMYCTITENGTYTVRLRDDNNKYYMKTFTVTNIDKDVPVIDGVTDNSRYRNTDPVVNISDKNLTAVYLDGKKVSKTNTQLLFDYDDAGWHTIKAVDRAGNTSKVKFKLRYTDAYFYKTYHQLGGSRVTVNYTEKQNSRKSIGIYNFKFSINTNVVDYDKMIATLDANEKTDRAAVKKIIKQYTFEELVLEDGTVSEELLADINDEIAKYYRDKYVVGKKRQITDASVTLSVISGKQF